MVTSTAAKADRTEDASSWRMPALIVGAGVVSAFQVGKAPLALDAIRADLGLEVVSASWILSAFALVGAVVSVAIGVFVDRLGARRAALLGLLLQGAGSGLGALSGALPLLLASRAIEGLGFLAVTVAAPALIVATTESRYGARQMAAWATFMPVGMALVMFAAPALAEAGWRGLWWGNAALLIGYAALMAIGTRAIPSARGGVLRRRVVDDMRQTLTVTGPWLLAGLFCAYTAAFFAVFGFLPIILSERLEVPSTTAAAMSAIAVAAGAIGCLVCGRLLAAGVQARHLLVAAFCVMSLSAIGILAAPVPGWMAYALCVVLSFFGAFIPVVIFDAAPRLAPRTELLGITIGLATQGNSLGIVIGPAAAGALVGTFGWESVAALTAAIAIAGATAGIALPKWSRTH